MSNTSMLALFIVFVGLGLSTGCQKVDEPWDTTGYFSEERVRTPEQEKALRHRLASIQETSQEQPWLHAQH